MEKNDVKEIYRQAVKEWGVQLQSMMAIEEMAELTKELVKQQRYEGSKAALAEEIADVQIMIDQLTVMYDLEPEVNKEIERKLQRLKKLLQGR